MKHKQKIGIFVLAIAVLVAASGLLTINALSVQPLSSNLTAKKLEPIRTTASADTSVIIKDETIDIQKLKERIPKTYEQAETLVMPIRSRFLMYTNDLRHIMWGTFGANHFVGVDNQGKRVWGIYYQGVFAGFYDGEFFWGKYSNGYWKATNLFGLPQSYGRYTTSPNLIIVPSTP